MTDNSIKDEECVICLSQLRHSPISNETVAVVDLEANVESQMKVEENGYFETPCKHNYHQECLKRWAETKLECPTCRTVLPVI